MQTLTLTAQPVSLSALRGVLRRAVRVELGAPALQKIEASRQLIGRIVNQDGAVYGVNTGFGLLAQTRIARERLVQLQRNLVLSHAAGTGPLLDDAVVKLVMVLKLISLARGYSGVRPEVLQALIAMVNAEACPCIPSRGSVGASGDLAPLAHLTAALLGEGHIRIKERPLPAAAALAQLGLKPLVLAPKEGLALLNGTQVSTALALKGLFAAEQVFAAGCPSMPSRAATPPSMPASTPRAVSPVRSRSRDCIAPCSPAAASASRTGTATRCRTPTRCAVSRR
jgi:histidine ammonia-lyase